MLRFKLWNKFFKNKTNEARTKYTKQSNVCFYLLGGAKRNYYNDLDLSIVTDDKKFWKMIRLVFGNKIKVTNKITLVEDNQPIKHDLQLMQKL